MKRSALVSLFASLAVGGAVAQKAPSKQPSLEPLVAVDSAGKILGRTLTVVGGNELHVIATINGATVTLMLVPASGTSMIPLKFATQGEIYFLDQSCQGTPYGGWDLIGTLASTQIERDSKVWLYIASGGPTPIRHGSRYVNGTCITEQGLFDRTLYPLSAPIDLTAQYSQPFTIR